MLRPRTLALASALLLAPGSSACVSRAATVVGDTTEFEVPVSPPRLWVTAACTDTVVRLQVLEERDCVRWEYRERYVGVPEATDWTAFGAQVVTPRSSQDHRDFEEAWPEPWVPRAPPARRRADRHSSTLDTCRIPAAATEFRVGDQTYATDDNGEVWFARTGGPITATHGDEAWVLDCSSLPALTD